MRTRYLLLALLPLAACDSNDPAPVDPAPSQVYVANQGGFGANTSSITSLDLDSETATNLLASTFGSTIQSTAVVGERLYVMSDEAGRVDVIDLDTNERIAQIASEDLTSARYFAAVGADKAYVTQLYLPDGSFSGGRVAVLDLSDNTVSSVIDDDSFSNPEGVAVVGQRAFVANAGFGTSTTLSVIDAVSDTVTGVVELGCSARAVLADAADGEVYAFCAGEVVVVTAATGAVRGRLAVPEDIRPLGTGGLGQDAALAAAETDGFDMVAVGTGGVLLLDSSDDAIVGRSVPGARAITAVGLPGGEDDRFVLGRADETGPFSASGLVTVHELSTGAMLTSLTAGIYPTFVTFADAR